MYSRTILIVPNFNHSSTFLVIRPKETNQIIALVPSQERPQVVQHLMALVLVEHIDYLPSCHSLP